MHKIVYINIDSIIAEFEFKMANQVNAILNIKDYEFLSLCHDLLPPARRGMEVVEYLLTISEFEVYFIATPHWNDFDNWDEKRIWLEQLFENEKIKNRLILCHQKELLKGDYLIDKSWMHGSMAFSGKWIPIGTDARFPDWIDVLEYLIEDINL